jgi:predicted ATPase
MDAKLTNLVLRGFTSIAEMDLAISDVNILIGQNGAGKSNLIKFFRMLSHMLSSPVGNLQRFVADQGGAGALLHDGPKRTPQIEASLTLETKQGTNEYNFRLFHAAGDTLIFAEESCRFSSRNFSTQAQLQQFGSGQREAGLLARADEDSKKTARTILSLLRRLVVYQFHDTSGNARIMGNWISSDGRYLKHDGGNLAPFLLRMKEEDPRHYIRIVETIRQIAPFFDDFLLDPDEAHVLLQWREQGSDMVFVPDQGSDGTLRAMMLISLLMQPSKNLPSLLILDEPELGLHPTAITIIGELIRAVSSHCQVLVATQSPLLLDQFDAGDIIVVQRDGRRSDFERLDKERLSEWLEDYALSDLWLRNVLGGRPRERGRA